jgi:hypothetical protein
MWHYRVWYKFTSISIIKVEYMIKKQRARIVEVEGVTFHKTVLLTDTVVRASEPTKRRSTIWFQTQIM